MSAKPSLRPTLSALIDAGKPGLILRNPDNGLEFRAVFAEVFGLCGVKIYKVGERRTFRDPIMSRDAIHQWLQGLEFGGENKASPARA